MVDAPTFTRKGQMSLVIEVDGQRHVVTDQLDRMPMGMELARDVLANLIAVMVEQLGEPETVQRAMDGDR